MMFRSCAALRGETLSFSVCDVSYVPETGIVGRAQSAVMKKPTRFTVVRFEGGADLASIGRKRLQMTLSGFSPSHFASFVSNDFTIETTPS
jgi:hypothetical protein